MSKKILAIITARGGSKRVPKKNLKLFNGKPLIYYTVIEALKSKYMDQICLTSDSDEIIDYCKSLGINEKYKRPIHLSADDTPSLPVIQDYVLWKLKTEDYKPDYILLLQPTSPLRTVVDIDNAIELIVESSADSIVGVFEPHHTVIPENIMRSDEEYIVSYLSSQDKNKRTLKPKYYGRNGAIYIFTYDCLMKKNSLYGDKIIPFLMSKESSIDIDDELDFEIGEYLIKKRDNL